MKIKLKVSKKAVEAQSSAEIVASMDDLLKVILLCLPIKSLIRFKLVSKHWQSIINSQEFILLRNPNPNPATALFLPYWEFGADHPNIFFEYIPFSVKSPMNAPFRKLDFMKDTWATAIYRSCNGLLVCCNLRAVDHIRRYFVYNPSTKKFTILPESLCEGGTWTRIHGMSLAFDPTKSPHYKVVTVWGTETEETGLYEYEFEVYSSETGRWRMCYGPFSSTTHFEDGVYWNGAIHWISYWTTESLYFSLADQVLEKMPLPPTLPISDDRYRRPNYYFGESCDHLHYIEIFGTQIDFNVYEMKRDYSEWFCKYKVDLSPIVAANPGMVQSPHYYACSIFTLVRGEKEEDAFMVFQIPMKAVRYNFVHKTFETIYEFEGDVVDDGWKYESKGFEYIESLCSV